MNKSRTDTIIIHKQQRRKKKIIIQGRGENDARCCTVIYRSHPFNMNGQDRKLGKCRSRRGNIQPTPKAPGGSIHDTVGRTYFAIGCRTVQRGRVRIDPPLGRRSITFIAQLKITTLPTGVHTPIPKGEKRLRKIRFDPPALVVDVMIRGIVGRDSLQRVPGDGIAAMVIDGFD